jgi:hypothetical protein
MKSKKMISVEYYGGNNDKYIYNFDNISDAKVEPDNNDSLTTETNHVLFQRKGKKSRVKESLRVTISLPLSGLA